MNGHLFFVNGAFPGVRRTGIPTIKEFEMIFATIGIMVKTAAFTAELAVLACFGPMTEFLAYKTSQRRWYKKRNEVVLVHNGDGIIWLGLVKRKDIGI